MNKDEIKQKIDFLLFSGIDANIEIGIQLNKIEKIYPRLAKFCIKYDGRWVDDGKAANVLFYHGIEHKEVYLHGMFWLRNSIAEKINYLILYFQSRWQPLQNNWGKFSLVHKNIITRFTFNLKWSEYKNHFFNTESNDLLQKKRNGFFKPEVISPIFGN